jgi:hypothetical protein
LLVGGVGRGRAYETLGIGDAGGVARMLIVAARRNDDAAQLDPEYIGSLKGL